MPVFHYTARDEAGRTVQGIEEAVGEGAVISVLQGRGLYVTQVTSSVPQKKDAKKVVKHRHKKISSEDLIFFIAQSANLLNVGIPFIRALDVISDQTNSQTLFNVIQEMAGNIKAGSTFKDAIARHPKTFPGYWVFLIEAGEVSGTLPHVLEQLAKNLEATERLKKKISSALIYPGVLITASILAITVFMVYVIPIFANLFKSFHAELPPITAFVLNLSNFMKHYFIFLILGIAGIVYAVRNYIATPGGRRNFHTLLLRTPVLGSAVSEIIHARVCLILSMLIRSGLNFLKSIEISSNVSGNALYETALSNIRLEVQQGRPFSACLAENSLFSPMFVNLVKIGEESGKLPEMIEKASEYFEARAELFAGRVGVLIEPLVMLFVGGIIGVIGVAMFLPILRIGNAIK